MSMTVNEYMQHKVVSVTPGTRLSEAVETLLSHRLTGAPVVDDEKKLIGFLSEQDCLAPLIVSSYHCEGEPLVHEVMSTTLVTVTPQEPITSVAELMTKSTPKIYPVVDDMRKLVGTITRSDVLKALVSQVETCYR